MVDLPKPRLDLVNADGSILEDVGWKITQFYNYSFPYYGWYGQMQLGSDQYAVYLITNISAYGSSVIGIDIFGALPRAAYLNVK